MVAVVVEAVVGVEVGAVVVEAVVGVDVRAVVVEAVVGVVVGAVIVEAVVGVVVGTSIDLDVLSAVELDVSLLSDSRRRALVSSKFRVVASAPATAASVNAADVSAAPPHPVLISASATDVAIRLIRKIGLLWLIRYSLIQ